MIRAVMRIVKRRVKGRSSIKERKGRRRLSNSQKESKREQRRLLSSKTEERRPQQQQSLLPVSKATAKSAKRAQILRIPRQLIQKPSTDPQGNTHQKKVNTANLIASQYVKTLINWTQHTAT
jgi:hypothetical protein